MAMPKALPYLPLSLGNLVDVQRATYERIAHSLVLLGKPFKLTTTQRH